MKLIFLKVYRFSFDWLRGVDFVYIYCKDFYVVLMFVRCLIFIRSFIGFMFVFIYKLYVV